MKMWNSVEQKMIIAFTFLILLHISCNNTEKKYEVFFAKRHLNSSFFDYEEALDFSKKSNKPLLIIFGGWGVSASVKFEKNIISTHKISSYIEENFILLNLYVDDRTLMPKNKWYKSTFSNNLVKTIGGKNGEFQIKKFQSTSQPYWAIINSQEKIILKKDKKDKAENFFLFLNKGVELSNKK